MDELIREIAIITPETGSLLVQIRDEINMSLSGYETIFASANGFGSLKALQAELGKEEKRDEVSDLHSKVEKYKKQISELKDPFMSFYTARCRLIAVMPVRQLWAGRGGWVHCTTSLTGDSYYWIWVSIRARNMY